MNATYRDFKVGDRVYCLAWIGHPFEVAAKDDERQIISLQGPAASSIYGAQVDIFPDTMWMLTHEKWDQIWWWPDREGERFDAVFDRFLDNHKVDELVAGYYFPGGLAGMFIETNPEHAMTFRIRALDRGIRQVRVHPVAAADANGETVKFALDESLPSQRWLRSGPTVPLRLEMRMYRWCLCFGEFVVNWQDLQPLVES